MKARARKRLRIDRRSLFQQLAELPPDVRAYVRSTIAAFPRL